MPDEADFSEELSGMWRAVRGEEDRLQEDTAKGKIDHVPRGRDYSRGSKHVRHRCGKAYKSPAPG